MSLCGKRLFSLCSQRFALCASTSNLDADGFVRLARMVTSPKVTFHLLLLHLTSPPSPNYSNETAERDAAIRLAAGAGTGLEKSPAIQGVGLARAAGVGSQELDNAADDERHLRKVKWLR